MRPNADGLMRFLMTIGRTINSGEVDSKWSAHTASVWSAHTDSVWSAHTDSVWSAHTDSVWSAHTASVWSAHTASVWSAHTTATVYCTVSAGNSCDVCRVSRTRQHGSSLVLEIRSHHASVAQPSLVASATKDNFQDRHSDVPMFEWTGTFLSGSRLHRSFCDTRSETVAICHLRAAVHSKNQNSDIWTEVIQGLWSNNLEWTSR